MKTKIKITKISIESTDKTSISDLKQFLNKKMPNAKIDIECLY